MALSNIEILLTRFDLDLLTDKSAFNDNDRNAVSAQLANFISRFRFKHDVAWLRPLPRIISDNDVIIFAELRLFSRRFS
jgi:hypothetical protein